MQKFVLFFKKNKVLIILLLFIVVVFILFFNKKSAFSEEPTQSEPLEMKKVSTYNLSDIKFVNLIGKVNKTGVITIKSQTSGIVSNIFYEEGDYVLAGNPFIEVGSNYRGDNSSKLNSQISYLAYANAKDNFDQNISVLDSQIDLVKKTDENTDNLNDINAKSITETKDLISLNKEVLNELKDYVATLPQTDEADPSSDSNLNSKRLLSQTESTINSLNSSLRGLEYTSDNNSTLGQISDLNRDTTIKQLELQKKALNLNKDILSLQFQVAKAGENMTLPSLNFDGVVERIFVGVGDFVNPNTSLVIIRGSDVSSKVTVSVSKNIAENVSLLSESIITIDDIEYKAFPTYVSTTPDSFQLYTITYDFGDQFTKDTADEQSIKVQVPISSTERLFVPIDSVFKSISTSYVNVLIDNKVETREVVLGEVIGSLIEISSGIESSDIIILDRNVVKGDTVQPL